MMKAVVYHKYGPPDVLMYEDMPKPVPGKDDVLLKVYAASVNPGGNCVVVGFSTLSHMLKVRIQSPRLSRKTGKSVGMLIPKEKSEDLAVLKEIFEKNKLEPVIDREYPLQEVPDAIHYLEEGHARGKVVITVNHTS